jgi:hypothetical protein
MDKLAPPILSVRPALSDGPRVFTLALVAEVHEMHIDPNE